MVTILHSNIGKKLNNAVNFHQAFDDLANFRSSSLLKIAVGYISEDSILFLSRNINEGSIIACQLIIGMHAFEGFTKPQYDAAVQLHNQLKNRNLGFVRVCKAFAFHGKIYYFIKDNNPHAVIIGSSNLDQITKNNIKRQWEVDTLIEKDIDTLKNIDELFNILIDDDTSLQIDDERIRPKKFKEFNSALSECDGIEKISEGIYLVKKEENATRYPLILKTEAKSNLNVFFGKGRLNTKTGIIRPRPWYEVEIVVSSNITKRKGYPCNRDFYVITDDGWKFRCGTNGDYAKNFRSKDDLKTLGMWIKGRMEAAGVLHIGDMITEDHLINYGRTTIDLISTSNPDIFLLDFSPQ